MSTPVQPGSPEQQAKKKGRTAGSPFRSFLLLAAIYSLIIHHVQKNKQASPPDTFKARVTTSGIINSVSAASAEQASGINDWNFRDASFIAPGDLDAKASKTKKQPPLAEF